MANLSRIASPEIVIRCPVCSGPANFSFATFAIIKKGDLQYFEHSKNFDVIRGQHSHGSYFNAALYYYGLADALFNITDLPDGYSSPMWESRWPRGEFWNRGAIHCTACFIRKKHELNWPADAYFQVEYRGKALWAYDRAHALKLLSYLESDERKKAVEYYVGEPWNTFKKEHWMLANLPTHFQTAKARPAIVKKLRGMLGLSRTVD